MFNDLPAPLQEKWQAAGFQEPTAIQKKVFQQMNIKESFAAISPTGTGKTLAYLIPLLMQLEANHQLQAVIFAPSQELAQQILQVSSDWGTNLGLTIMSLIGGANTKRQIEQLKKKPELIIATPGRFLELLKQTAKLKVHTVQWLIYDEADYLLAKTNQSRQDLELIEGRMMRDVRKAFISATQSEDLLRYLDAQSPVPVLLKSSIEEQAQPVTHMVVLSNNRNKVENLRRLTHLDSMKALVFFDRISDLERVAAKLIYEQVPISVLHSDLSNQERKFAISLFNKQETKLLLTTEVAARGIDLPDIPYVIHFHSAKTPQSYIHRSGRTGRMGAKGQVISLVNEQEARDLKKMLASLDIQLERRRLYRQQLIAAHDDLKVTKSKRPVQNRKKSKKAGKKTNKRDSITRNHH